MIYLAHLAALALVFLGWYVLSGLPADRPQGGSIPPPRPGARH